MCSCSRVEKREKSELCEKKELWESIYRKEEEEEEREKKWNERCTVSATLRITCIYLAGNRRSQVQGGAGNTPKACG